MYLIKNLLKEIMSLGAAGGSTIISGVASAAFRTLWINETVKESIDAPRLHNQLCPNVTYYEKDWPQVTLIYLKKKFF